MMQCRQWEELLSDHLEGSLPPEQREALEAHLDACTDCRELQAAFAEVVAALHALPALEAPADLAGRVAEHTLRAAHDGAWTATAVPAAAPLPRWVPAVAALLFVGLTLTVVGGSQPKATARFYERVRAASTYVVERKDRLVEDVRVLRAVVGTAFEQRLDRVEERVEDYLRLVERQRAREKREKGAPAGPGAPQSTFENPAMERRVHPIEAALRMPAARQVAGAPAAGEAQGVAA